MFHNDVQTQHINNWKRSTNDHPINRILTTYFHSDKQIRNSPSMVRSNNHKSETNHILQRQRLIRSFLNKPDETESLIRKPLASSGKHKVSPTTSISSPHVLFAELNEQQSTNNNNRPQTIKKELERQSPTLIRRHRTLLENLSIQERSDITNIYGHYLPSPTPTHVTLRNNISPSFLCDKSSLQINNRISTPHIKPLHYSKTISENNLKQHAFNSKDYPQNNFLPMHRWTPILSEQGKAHSRITNSFSRSKSYLSKYSIKRHFNLIQSERTNPNSKISNIQDFCISPRSFTSSRCDSDANKKKHQKKTVVDEWEDSKWNNSVVSDEDESVSADGNSSTSTCTSQVSLPQYDVTSSANGLSDERDLSFSPNLFTGTSNSPMQRPPSKRSLSRRRTYNIALPTVTENVNAEETDMKNILDKLYALQNNVLYEKATEQSIDDEESLTFQLLNQQETDFEKKISKSKKRQI
ncbi:unnamed protein product [Rotaria magnacalcarata]|uniref:Uncharacterized protein n=1 Tax=Rotaria magnacalcarata TaxID=392030 RepID=A0A816SCY9_9BILA|nr:unnamed protein product [Rotaria magnacalcarata]CAF2079956.1 unnamed protein product [Rotaria magnacalcarata]CAF3925560.1 unnamed protein product [Rotaria magnacalcarata]CAF4025391.1 unnamed protein product [Rotaria magnacalcarata]